MEYEKEVHDKITLVDSVFESLEVPNLSANRDFAIDRQYHYGHHVKFSLHKLNCIGLELIFNSDALQINIDRVSEAFEWSEKQIQGNPDGIKDIVKMIFISTIKVERCGSNYTKVSFYNEKGNCMKTLKYVTGLYLKIGCKTKEYSPVYK